MRVSGLSALLIAVAMLSFGVSAHEIPVAHIVFDNASQTNMPNPPLVIQSKDARVADIDNDGDLDVVIAHEYKANVLLVNDGSGRFSNESVARLPQIHRDSEDILTADFDGDGSIDLLFVSEDDETNELYLNDGSGIFLQHPFSAAGITNGVAGGDINEDGVTDIVLGNTGTNSILIGQGDGRFTDETADRLPDFSDTTQDVELGDIDGDGDLDLIGCKRRCQSPVGQ